MSETITADRRITEHQPKSFKAPGVLASIGWIVLFMVLQGVSVIAAIMIDAFMSGDPGAATKFETMSPSVIILGILIGAVPLIALRSEYLQNMLNARSAHNSQRMWLYSLGGVGTIIVASWLYQTFILAGQPMQPEIILFLRAMESGIDGLILTYLMGAVVAPVLEEILFRGQLQGAIQTTLANRVRHAPAIAIVITSAAFALIHLQPLAMPLLFLTGLVMGWLRYKSNSLLIPIVMHVGMNAFSLTLLLVTGEL